MNEKTFAISDRHRDGSPGHEYEVVTGEEDDRYWNLLARYTHQACPLTIREEQDDVCGHPSDCALAGMCLDLWEKRKNNAPTLD